MFANMMGFHGVAYYFTNPDIAFMPGPEYFPVDTKSAGFFEGDQVRYTGLNDGSIFQVDSTAICKLSPEDVGKKTVTIKRINRSKRKNHKTMIKGKMSFCYGLRDGI